VKRYLLLASSYVGLVILANWLASRYVVSVGFGRMAPAGVFCIGGVLVLRDWLQQLRGLVWTMPLVYAAGLASWGIGDAAGWTSLEKVAVASVVAFTVSETVEAIVFTPIRKRNLTLGVGLSGTVGNALDSWLFLQLAFGSQAFFLGQFIGKSEMIALGTVVTLARRRLLPARVLETDTRLHYEPPDQARPT
jgi:queuosine precursor transporter